MNTKTDEEIAARLWGPPPSPGAVAEGGDAAPMTAEPAADVAARIYKPTEARHPAEREWLTKFHEPLTVELNVDQATREALVREFSDVVKPTGFDLYDPLVSILADGLISQHLAAVRSPQPDAIDRDNYERERYTEAVGELRSLYGDDQFESLQTRVNTWLGTQPKFNQVIADAGMGNHPVVVRRLFQFVRDNDLGRTTRRT